MSAAAMSLSVVYLLERIVDYGGTRRDLTFLCLGGISLQCDVGLDDGFDVAT